MSATSERGHEPGDFTGELEVALKEEGVLSEKLVILGRRPNKHQSTFPSEIITCELDGHRRIEIFCKYSRDVEHAAHGHRGGVEYEAQVYRRLLRNLDLPRPNLLAIYRKPSSRYCGVLLEYLADSTKVTRSRDPDAMDNAARWIGRFHALVSEKTAAPELSFLRRYDPDYYRGWSRRALEFAEHFDLDSAWLRGVCRHFEEGMCELLCRVPSTIIHGEYYSGNILLRAGSVYPVDWESAAIGCGEIDLATLTDGWPCEVRRRLEHEYERARWPDGAPDDFEEALYAARMYVHFRWLGERPEWLRQQDRRIEELRTCAEEMGLN